MNTIEVYNYEENTPVIIKRIDYKRLIQFVGLKNKEIENNEVLTAIELWLRDGLPEQEDELMDYFEMYQVPYLFVNGKYMLTYNTDEKNKILVRVLQTLKDDH